MFGYIAFDAGGKNKVGPALWNIVNRPMAAADGYDYSDALVDLVAIGITNR